MTDFEDIKTKMANIAANETSYSNIKKLQQLEDDIREYKKYILKKLNSQNQMISLDDFFGTMISFLGSSYLHIDKFYSFDKRVEYGKDSEIYVPQYAKIHVITMEQYWSISKSDQSPHYTAYLKAFRNLLENHQDFLIYSPEDDSLFKEVFKTDEEILLPFGSSMKYFPGNDQDNFRTAIKITSDYLNNNGIPLSLRLK